jgi:hypothetical protein
MDFILNLMWFKNIQTCIHLARCLCCSWYLQLNVFTLFVASRNNVSKQVTNFVQESSTNNAILWMLLILYLCIKYITWTHNGDAFVSLRVLWPKLFNGFGRNLGLCSYSRICLVNLIFVHVGPIHNPYLRMELNSYNKLAHKIWV